MPGYDVLSPDDVVSAKSLVPKKQGYDVISSDDIVGPSEDSASTGQRQTYEDVNEDLQSHPGTRLFSPANKGDQRSVMGISTPNSAADIAQTKQEFIDKPAQAVKAGLGQAVSLAAFPAATVADTIQGGDYNKEALSQSIDDFTQQKKQAEPDQSMGFTGRMVRGLEELAPLVLAGPAAVPLITAEGTASKGIELEGQGVTGPTNSFLSALSGAVSYGFTQLPFTGKSLTSSMVRGATMNPLLGAAHRLAEKETLAANDYDTIADSIKVVDPDAAPQEIAMGMLFGFLGGKDRPLYGKTAAENLVPFWDTLKESNWYREKTIPERGLVIQDTKTVYDNLLSKGYSEGDIAKMGAAFFKEALTRRSAGEATAEPPAYSPDAPKTSAPAEHIEIPDTGINDPSVSVDDAIRAASDEVRGATPNPEVGAQSIPSATPEAEASTPPAAFGYMDRVTDGQRTGFVVKTLGENAAVLWEDTGMKSAVPVSSLHAAPQDGAPASVAASAAPPVAAPAAPPQESVEQIIAQQPETPTPTEFSAQENREAVEQQQQAASSPDIAAKIQADQLPAHPVDLNGADPLPATTVDAPPASLLPAQEGVSSPIVRTLAKAADKALDTAYGYGLSAPETFGSAANQSSAAHALELIQKGNTDVETLASAIHEGWAVTARTFPGQPIEKKAKRLELAATPYADLPEEEKEKDRVSARAILSTYVQAVKPAAPPAAIETPLPAVQQEFIRNKVKALGSLEAVRAKYADPVAPVDRYAAAYANQIFQKAPVPIEAQPTPPVSKPPALQPQALEAETQAPAAPTYVKPSTIDTPAQGSLNAARERKANLWKQITTLRQKIQEEPIGGNRLGMRLDLLKLQDAHATAQRAERDSLQAIEKRANELGKTTIKPAAKVQVGVAAPPARTVTPAEIEGTRAEIAKLRAPEPAPERMPETPRLAPTAPTAQADAAAKVTAASRKVDRQKDDIAVAISKLGGIDFDQAHREWGDMVKDGRKALAAHVHAQTRRFGSVFKAGGMPLDKMRESLIGHGYLPEGADLHDLYSAIEPTTRGQFSSSIEKSHESDIEREAREHEEHVIAGMTEEAKAAANDILDTLEADDSIEFPISQTDTSLDFGYNLEGHDETRDEAEDKGNTGVAAPGSEGEGNSPRQTGVEPAADATDDAGGWHQSVAIEGARQRLTIGEVQKQGGRRTDTADLVDGFTPAPVGLFKEAQANYNEGTADSPYTVSSVSAGDSNVGRPNGLQNKGHEYPEPEEHGADDADRPPTGVHEQFALFTANANGTPTPEALQVAKVTREVKTFSKTASVITGHVRTGLTHITSPHDLAHVMAGLRKKTQENLVIVVTNDQNKIVGIIDQTTGSTNASIADPALALGASHLVEGARNIYLVHNHPTGDSSLSDADIETVNRIDDASRGTGLVTKGIMAIGVKTANFYTPHGWDDGAFDIPAAVRGHKLPVEGVRIFTRRPAANTFRIGGAAQVPQALRDAGLSGEGVALLDGKNRIVGFVPMQGAEMGELRTGDKDTGAGLLTKTIRQVNSVGMIAVTPDTASARNLGSFGRNLGVRLLDIYDPDTQRSAAESGQDTENGKAWFSPARRDAAETGTTVLDPAAITKVQGLISRALPGKKVTVNIVDHISPPDDADQAWAAHGKTGGSIAGMHQKAVDLTTGEARSVITLAIDGATERTGYHEVMHAAEALGLVSPKDSAILQRAYPDKEGVSSSERQAEAFADYVENGTRPHSFAKIVFDRILAFLKKVKQFAMGRGWRTAADVFKDIESGKAKERTETSIAPETQLSATGPRSPFYSKLSEVVNNKMGGKMHVLQLNRMLENNGVTRDEIDNVMGEFVGRETVSKAEVQEAIKANSVPLKDVVLGEDKAAPLEKSLNDLGDQQRRLTQSDRSPLEFIDEWNAIDSQRKAIIEQIEQSKSESSPAHFSQYTEPGAVGGSYREMFVTAPGLSRPGEITPKNEWVEQQPWHQNWKAGGSNQQIADNLYDQWIEREKNGRSVAWKDGHSQYSNIQNPIVRIRFNEREVDGKRVLFVEEMQGPNDANQQKMPDYLRKRIYDLGVKRILAYAKENGFDGVSWTPGAMQAGRYDLSKQISKVEATKTSNGNYALTATDNSGRQVTDGVYAYDELPEVVGKDLAQKIINEVQPGPSEGRRHNKTYSGLDLKVGGEGLAFLYDRTLPALFKKYGKERDVEVTFKGREARPVIKGGFSTREEADEYLDAQGDEDFVVRLNRRTGNYDVIDKTAVNQAVTAPMVPITDKTPASYPQYALAEDGPLAVPPEKAAHELLNEKKPTFLKRLRNAATIDPVPHLNNLTLPNGQTVGDAAVQHASARIYVPHMVDSLLAEVFPSQYHDPEAMAATIDILNKDNILGGFDDFTERANAAEAAGDEQKAKRWLKAADDVAASHDLPAYANQVRAAAKNPTIMGNIERWKDTVNPLLDMLFNEVKRVDPNTELEGRGRFYDTRINLLPGDSAEMWATYTSDVQSPMPSPSVANYRNPNISRDPYDRAAKFTGEYSDDARLNLIAVLSHRWNEATKLRLYDALVKSGAAIEEGPGVPPPPEIQGQQVARMGIKFPRTDSDGTTFMSEKSLYIRRDIASELRGVLDTDLQMTQNPVLKWLTGVQLLQVADAVTHSKNIMTVVTRAQGAGSAWADVVRKMPALGTADAIVRIARVANEVLQDTPAIRQEIAQMAAFGMIRPTFPPVGLQKFTHAQQVLHQADTAARLVLYRFHTNLVERGLAKDSLESRRNFINQVGQYNRRLMIPIMKTLRDWGAAPFIVAGRNFNRQGRRWVTGDPGVTPSGEAAAWQMRVTNMLGLALLFTIPAMLNMLTTGKPGGRSGTPMGAWDLGMDEDNKGKHKVVDLLQITGVRRGLRVTGMEAVIEGLRSGESVNEITGKAINGAVQSQLHPWMGPGPAWLFKAATGKQPDMRGRMESQRISGGGGMQFLENVRAATESQNPFLYAMISPVFQQIGLDQKPHDSALKEVGMTLLKSPASAFGVQDKTSAARQEMAQIWGERGGVAMTPHDALKGKLKGDLRGKESQEIREALQAEVENGSITKYEALKLRKGLSKPQIAAISAFTPEEMMRVITKATPEEMRVLKPIFNRKIGGSKVLTSEQKRQYREQLDDVAQ